MSALKYLLYARKSSEADDRQILSIEGQIEVMEDYARQHDLTIVETIHEAASAKEPGREGFAKFMHLLRISRAIEVQRSLNSQDVLDVLRDLFVQRGTPAYVRSDNGAEFTAHAVQGLARPGGGADALHRVGESLGERALRELQRQAPR